MASTGLINLEPMKWGGKDLTMVASKGPQLRKRTDAAGRLNKRPSSWACSRRRSYSNPRLPGRFCRGA